MTASIYTGRNAKVWLSGSTSTGTCTGFAFADFSISLKRDVIEQSLMCQEGNYFTQGPLSIEGSLTHTKMLHSPILKSIVDGSVISMSGTTCDTFNGTGGVSFYFENVQVTGYDISIGDGSTVTTASVDFTVMDPYNIGTATCWISGAT